MSTYEIIAVVFSSVSLFFTLIALIKNIIVAYKNRVTAATFTVELDDLRVTNAGANDWVHCNLLLTNHTRKEFTVGRIVVTIEGTPCPCWRVIEKPKYFFQPGKVEELLPFRVMPCDIVNICLYIESPPLELPAAGTLAIMTSYEKIDYPVLIPCNGKNNADKA